MVTEVTHPLKRVLLVLKVGFEPTSTAYGAGVFTVPTV